MTGLAYLGAVVVVLLPIWPHASTANAIADFSSPSSTITRPQQQAANSFEFIADANESGFSGQTSRYTVHARPGQIHIEWASAPTTLIMRPIGGHPVQAIGVEARNDRHGHLGPRASSLPFDPVRFDKLRYPEIYQGIDLDLYSNRDRLEYDFIVSPGAEPTTIRMAFEGADGLVLAQDGALIIRAGMHTFRQPRPVIYQRIGDHDRPIAGDFVLYPDATIGFRLGDYDPLFAVIIDPILEYGSFIGGSGTDQIQAITTDAQGNTYVTGMTTSGGLPGGGTTADQDAFVSKFAANGIPEFTIYLGGTDLESGQGIAVDASGIYVSGWTSSLDFPVTDASHLNLGSALNYSDPTLDPSYRLRDAFVAKLSPTDGSVLYTTYLGGTADDAALALQIDGSGRAYVTGFTASSDFPMSGTPYQDASGGLKDAFVTRITSTGSLDYSTYIGGQGEDVARDIAVDASGRVTLTGFTGSGDYDNSAPPNATTPFPTTANAYDIYCGIAETITVSGSPTAGRCNGKGTSTQSSTAYDAFVTRLDPAQTPASAQLIYSTFLGGGRYDYGNSVALDTIGDIIIGGETVAADFPVTMEPCSDNDNDGRCDLRSADGFIAKIHPAGAGSADLVFARYLAGDAEDIIQAITLDTADRIYATGSTTSRDFPVLNPIQSSLPQRQDEAVLVLHRDAFLSEFSADGSQFNFSSYLGGRGDDQGTAIALDTNGVVHLGGYTVSANLPTSADAAQSAHGDLQTGNAVTADDGFLLRVGTQGGDLAVTLSHNAPDPLTLGETVTFTAVITNLGTNTAEGVTLTDVLPPQAVIFDATQSDPSCSQYSGTIECVAGSIGAGQSKSLNIVVKPKNQGDYTHTVSTSGLLSEADSSNNQAASVLHVAYVASSEGGSAAVGPISLLLIVSPAALMIFRRWRLRVGDEAC